MPRKETASSDAHIAKLRGMRYQIIGRHSAAKLCHWTRQSLLNNRFCYKQKFYGIQSHRCLQMTPSLYCQLRCLFCWRPHDFTPELNRLGRDGLDEPETIIEGSLEAQKTMLNGYYGVMDRVNEKKLNEAEMPKHVAISLSGEPTTYPYLSELIEGFGKKGMTTFLVTNGLLPNVLERITLPTQLYISLVAPNEQIHKKLNIPIIAGSWKCLNSTLELLPSLDTRKVIRITAVKEWNMVEASQYAKLIEKAQPDFIEVKSYMFVGYSRQRLTIENMPSHEETTAFAAEIQKTLPGYEIVDEKKDSRVVLLSNNEKEQTIKF